MSWTGEYDLARAEGRKIRELQMLKRLKREGRQERERDKRERLRAEIAAIRWRA